MRNVGSIISEMVHYNLSDARRINHFMKVYAFAKAIGELENLDVATQEILEIAAITHDIGIKNSELKYGSSAGNYQQIEGPPEAEKMLRELGIADDVVSRVSWLIAHHHTYHDIKELDYQILVEADFLVNAFEDEMSKEAILSVKDKIFKTKSGIDFLETLFLVEKKS